MSEFLLEMYMRFDSSQAQILHIFPPRTLCHRGTNNIRVRLQLPQGKGRKRKELKEKDKGRSKRRGKTILQIQKYTQLPALTPTDWTGIQQSQVPVPSPFYPVATIDTCWSAC